jgi:hypothetical protein
MMTMSTLEGVAKFAQTIIHLCVSDFQQQKIKTIRYYSNFINRFFLKQILRNKIRSAKTISIQYYIAIWLDFFTMDAKKRDLYLKNIFKILSTPSYSFSSRRFNMAIYFSLKVDLYCHVETTRGKTR